MRGPINDYVVSFRKRLVDTETPQFQSMLDFAARAYRRPLDDSETKELANLYNSLRKEALLMMRPFA